MPYDEASRVLEELTGIKASDTSIFRICEHYGNIADSELSFPDEALEVSDEPVYAQVDGSMILTDHEWKEVKLGRVFAGDRLEESQYCGYLGNKDGFVPRMNALIDPCGTLGNRLCIIADGASWIRNWADEHYPDARQILDFNHASEHLGEFARDAVGEVRKNPDQWLDRQIAELLEGDPKKVVARIRSLLFISDKCKSKQREILGYLASNLYRMEYAKYREEGLLIGSGAIEAAHRTVVQRRLKLSGQRWSLYGAKGMLALRICYKSGRWDQATSLIGRAA